MLQACVLSSVGAHEKNPSWSKFLEPFTICNSHNRTVDLGNTTPEIIIKLLVVVDDQYNKVNVKFS